MALPIQSLLNPYVIPIYSPTTILTQNAVMCNANLERAGVLYNLGAIVSASAAATERTSDEGLKLACKQFQEAAGIFAHIQEKVVANLAGAVTPDLSEQGLGMIKSLMLAQVQACFYEKAIRTVGGVGGLGGVR